MRIKITPKNATAIDAALREVNGRADRFTITSWLAVSDYAAEAERRLESSLLPKASRSGVVVRATPAGPRANSYKYAAKSTTITIERGAQSWYLTAVYSADVYPRQAERVVVTISEAQRAAIQARAVAQYTIAKPLAEATDGAGTVEAAA